MIDIVIPLNNEKEFIRIAEKLSYKGICFLYDIHDFENKKLKIKSDNKKFNIYFGIIANQKNISKIKSKNDDVFVAYKSYNDREVMEGSKADIIFGFEESFKRDFMHQRASGLNHILCRLAKDNNVVVGFSLSSILNAKEPHVIMGRMMQNIILCRKFKVKNVIGSFTSDPMQMRSPHDLSGLFLTLGMNNPKFLNSEHFK